MRMIKDSKIGQTAMMVCALIMIFNFADLEAAQWNGHSENLGDVINMMNPEKPMLPPETIQTEEMWRVGADDDEDAELVGFVTDVIMDEKGNSYLLDSTLNVIRIFAPDGASLGEIGRKGEGPGEFGMTSQFIFLPSQEIGVIQMIPAKVVTLNRKGLPGSDFSLGGGDGGMTMIQNAGSYDDGVVLGMVEPKFIDGSMVITHSLAVHNSTGETLHTILEKKEKQSGGNINIGGGGIEFTRRWSVGPDGKVYVAQHEQEYKIEVFNASGKAERVINRDYKSVKRSAKDIAEDEERNADMAARFGGDISMEVPEFERDIGTLHPRNDGQLWVENSRGRKDCPEGQLGYFDEYDAEGKFLRRVSIAVEYDSDRDNYVLVDDLLYILKEGQKQPETTSTGGGGGNMMVMISGNSSSDEDEDEEGMPPGVVCYKLVR
ncbi:MAG: hypothetical protein GY780_06740 [bacterium]|nr:hypothetical protein [bacterium]